LLLFGVIQDVAHRRGGSLGPHARQRLGRGQLIAGFEVSINCRFWVSTEARTGGGARRRPSRAVAQRSRDQALREDRRTTAAWLRTPLGTVASRFRMNWTRTVARSCRSGP
jgi:hypothetical protein